MLGLGWRRGWRRYGVAWEACARYELGGVFLGYPGFVTDLLLRGGEGRLECDKV